MGDFTTDPRDPRLKRVSDRVKTKPHEVYLVAPQLPEEYRERGFKRPLRMFYIHKKCGTATRLSKPIAETYARYPMFYTSTYCANCQMHLPIEEFNWPDNGATVGT